MFGIEKNRINIFFSEDSSTYSVIEQLCSMSYNDINTLKVHLPEKFGKTDPSELNDKLFRIDWLVIYRPSENISIGLLDQIIDNGHTILITTNIKSNWYKNFDREYKKTFFLYETSWDREGMMSNGKEFDKLGASYMMGFGNEKNDYYLKNLQTENKYSLRNWMDIEYRKLKFKKL